MVERVLDYDRAIVRQETSFWCGPGATQVVLDALGIRVPEAELAREIGTHSGGTDTTHWIVDRSLSQRVPQAGYTVVWLPRDPPTPEQCETLWQHLTRSISAGYGLIVNWEVAPDNRPQGVRGSVSPGYPWTSVGDPTRHYVAYMGFYEGAGVPGGRAVWVADSANFGGVQGFWISFWQACTLIPPKSYAWAANSPLLPAPAPPPPPAPVAPGDGVGVLSEAMGGSLDDARYAQLLPAVTDALVRCDCLSVERIAMWCAQIGHESAGLKYMEEIADGSAYEGRQDLGNTQPGDGTRFKGRGPIQVTGRHNYTVLSAWAYERGYVDDPQFFVHQPSLLGSDEFGFLGVVWYWTVARVTINAMADAWDLEGVTRAINGGLHGLQDRQSRYQRALGMGDELRTLLIAVPEPEPPPFVPPPPPPPAAGEVPWAEILELQRQSATVLAQLAAVVADIAAKIQVRA